MEMKVFSEEISRELVAEILEKVEAYMKAREKIPHRLTGLMTKREVFEELDINGNTLKRWETLGLKRYMPPVENTKKAYYRVSDVLKFLGADL